MAPNQIEPLSRRRPAQKSELPAAEILEQLAEAAVDWRRVLSAMPQVDEAALRNALREAASALRQKAGAPTPKAERRKDKFAPADESGDEDSARFEWLEIAAEERSSYGQTPFVVRGDDGEDFVFLKLEPVRPVENIQQIIVHVDGCCKGNPGPSACGVVFLAPGGEMIAEGCAYLGEMTNNAAEYHALIAAFLQALEWGKRQLIVFSDSELLVKQMNGEYRARSPLLFPLIKTAQELRRKFTYCAIRHVPRERNSRADQLANWAIRRYSRH